MKVPFSALQSAALLAAACAQGALAAPIAPAALDAMVKAEAPATARHWSLVPLFRLVDGSTIELDQNGTVELGRDGLQSILGRIDSDKHRSVVRWIIAHETWHQVQRRDFGQVRPEDQLARRQLECEADVVATHYMVDLYLKENGNNAALPAAKSLAGALKNIIVELQAAEQQFGGMADHPSGAQRRSAVTLGSVQAFGNHLSLMPEGDERNAFAYQIAQVTDYQDGERIGDWAARMCHLILHAGDGVEDLTELPRQIKFNEDGNPPIVDFQLPYKNTGKLPISVVVQVATLAVPRASPEDADSWQKADAVTYRFDLAPGQQYTLSGRLYWVATANAFPRLLYPMARGSMYNAVRSEALSTDAQEPDMAPLLSARLGRLASTIQLIANAANDQFKSIRQSPCRNADGNRMCPLTVTVPSAKGAEIVYEGDGGAAVDITLYEGTNAPDAARVYAEFRDDLKTIYPFQTFRERTTASGGKVLTYVPTPTSKFELRQLSLPTGTMLVTATVVPAAFAPD